jgi:hypothetical protein
MSQGRVLLECPYGWRWYLGDRVIRQSLGAGFFRVPGPLPPRVLRTQEYTLAEIEAYTVLDTELVFGPSEDYAGYVASTLASDLGMERRLAPSTASERRAPVLPELRREIEVVLPGGRMGIVDVPAVNSSVSLAATTVRFNCIFHSTCLLSTVY